MTFENTQIFINSGWNVVPYDTISYDSNGRKVAMPPVKWSQYLIHKNKEISNAGALICGEQLVIDCDNENSAKLILNIMGLDLNDLTKNEIKHSIGLIVKTKRGYHFYFNGDKDISDCKGEGVDIQATNKKLVYLPTKTSEGKSVISFNMQYDSDLKCNVLALHNLPTKLKQYILGLKDSKFETSCVKEIRYVSGVPLASIKKGTELFYKRLTPVRFKEKPYYRKIIDDKGFLYPDDVKDGDGNDYLVSIAGILTTDPTIDINTYWEILHFINAKWSRPLESDVLESRFKGFVENSYPNIPFIYDDDWNKLQYSFTDVDNNQITILYDLDSSKYIIAYLDSGKVMVKNNTEVTSFYANRKLEIVSANKLASSIPCAKIICDPTQNFGFNSKKEFNTFKKTKYVEILSDDSVYSTQEIEDSKKCLALDFFKHLFKEQTDYFLRFLKKKLTNFRYSSTCFCLFDIYGGAGKGALESYLGHFAGMDKVVRIPYATFISKFTSDLEGKLFVFLNEYPDEYKQRKDVTDKLKDITGSPIAKIEKKGQDPYETKNLATYFITSNRVSIEVKDGDRRFLVTNCQNKFDDVFRENYFEDMTSEEELTKLAVYLKYIVGEMDNKEYMQPPMSADKENYLDIQGSEIDIAIRAMKTKNWDYFLDLDPELLVPRADALNITLLSVILNTKTRTLIRCLKQHSKLGVEIKKDNNQKLSTNGFNTFALFEIGTMSDLL